MQPQTILMKIKILLSILSVTMTFALPCIAQSPEDAAEEVQPIFRGGGIDTFTDWVQKRVMYAPDSPYLTKVDIVTVSFTVDKKGKISDVSGEAMIDPKLRDEVVKVIGKAPKMTPGTRNGQPAEFHMTAEIKFDAGMRKLLVKRSNEAKTPKEQLFPRFTKKSNPETKQASTREFRTWVVNKVSLELLKYKRDEVRAVVEFVLNREGYIECVQVVESSCRTFAEIVVETLYSCPKWYSPGIIDGEPVRVVFELPVVVVFGE